MEGTGNQGNPNEVGIPEVTPGQLRQASVSLLNNYSSLSSQGQSVIEGLAADVMNIIDSKASSDQHTYDVPRTENNASRNDTPPPLPSSPPPSTLSRRHSSNSGISSEASSNFLSCFDNGKKRLSSISESEMLDTVDRAVEVVSSQKVQEQLENKIKSDPSFLKKMQEKWNSLDNKDKLLFGLKKSGKGMLYFSPILIIIGLAMAIIGGLKLATPSKAEFKKFGQEIKHSVKSAVSMLPGETNLEKLWKSIHKPGVTAENPDLEPFLTKYCFPDQESGKQVKVKFDSDKIEALKATVKTVGLDLDQDIDRIVRKGDSIFKSDYVKTNKDGIDTQFITTIDEIATKVMAKDHRIEDKFKDKLTEVKQAKEEKAANQETSFLDKIKDRLSPNRNSSHAEGIEERRGSDSNRSRSH